MRIASIRACFMKWELTIAMIHQQKSNSEKYQLAISAIVIVSLWIMGLRQSIPVKKFSFPPCHSPLPRVRSAGVAAITTIRSSNKKYCWIFGLRVLWMNSLSNRYNTANEELILIMDFTSNFLRVRTLLVVRMTNSRYRCTSSLQNWKR